MKEEKGGNTKRSQGKILPSKRMNSEISERKRSSGTKSMQLNRAVARVQKAMERTSTFLGKEVISIDQLGNLKGSGLNI